MLPDNQTSPDNQPTPDNRLVPEIPREAWVSDDNPTARRLPDPVELGAIIDTQLQTMRALYEVAAAPIEALPHALNDAAQAIAAAFRVEYVMIHLNNYHEQTTRIAAEYPVHGYAGQIFPFAETPVHAYFGDHPEAEALVINDVNQPNTLFDQAGSRAFFDQAGIKSCLVVPLRVKENILGTMHLMMVSRVREVSKISLPFVQSIANLLTVSIQNVQLAATLNKQIDQVEQISVFGQQVMTTQDQGQIIREAAVLVRRFIAVDGVSVALHWQGEPTLRLYLLEDDRLLPPITIAYEQAWLRYACEARTPLVLNTLSGGTQLDYEALIHNAPPDSWRDDKVLQTALIIPMIAGGQPVGTFNLLRAQPYSFTPDDLTAGGQIANQVAVALENVHLFTQTADQLRSERLRAQLGGRTGRGTAEHVDDILIAGLQQVGLALGAQRARVRLSPGLTASESSAGSTDQTTDRRPVKNG